MARVASWLAFGFVGVAASGTAATSVTACGESGACTNLRETEYANLVTWQACDPAGIDQCIIEPGNPKDCTGVLSCNFAVNPKFRAEAEQAVYTSGQASQGCYLCAVPNCIAAEEGICEPVSRRCIAVSGTTDGGLLFAGEDGGSTSTGTPPSGDAGNGNGSGAGDGG
jgi:hypothetical protein